MKYNKYYPGRPDDRDGGFGRSKRSKIVGIVLCVAGALLIGVSMALRPVKDSVEYYVPPPPAQSEASPEQDAQPETYFPVGALLDEENPTELRSNYEDGSLQLYIPRLKLEVPVFGGVDDETLKNNVGLFGQATLPRSMDINSNTCIAGHRDIHNKEFYYIDTMQEGDRMYLLFQDTLFTYEVEDSFFTDAYDWDPIRIKPYPVLTLQSCHPIGIATDRIFVVGRMIEATPGVTEFPTE